MGAAAAEGIPAASLIICSRDRPELLLASVESVLRGTAVPAELLVVDQSIAPHPALSGLVTERPCAIRYLWTRSVGLSRACNIGVAASRHDLVVFTHDDVEVTPAWFDTLVRALVDAGPRSVVTGQVLPSATSIPGGFAPTIKVDDTPAAYEGRGVGEELYPLNMAMHRVIFSDVGLFDERLGPGTPFPAAEDGDFGFRLLEAGYRIVYRPEAALYHVAWRRAQDYGPLRWSYGRGQGAFFAKHLSWRDRYMLWRLCRDIAYTAYQFIRHARNQRHLAHGDALYIGGLLSGAGQWLLTQRKTSTFR